MAKFNKVLAAIALVFGAAVFINLGNAGAANAACVNKVYNRGDSGTCVKYIQTLANYHFSKDYPKHAKIAVDGKFGSNTESAIKSFQKRASLSKDEVVGKKTWWSLCQTGAAAPDENGEYHAVMVQGFPVSDAKAAGCKIYW